MQIIFSALFLAIWATAIFLITKRIQFIKKAILLGKTKTLVLNKKTAWLNVLRLGFGQQKMFDKPLIGIMHFIIYASFLLINIEIFEILIDGIFGTHRFFAPFLGGFYVVMIGFFEFLALGAFVFALIFLTRRLSGKVLRLSSLSGWAKKDGILILVFESILMFAFLTLNASEQSLFKLNSPHYTTDLSALPISSLISSLFFSGASETFLLVYERLMWWLHIIGILFFAIYTTYSKHLHILLGFPNAYFKPQQELGKLNNMEQITKEVKIMLGMVQDDGSPAEPGRFGAKDVNDLSWKNLMDAFSCTECGRCQAVCPANQTGKKLSPRKIMMDVRDRAEEATTQLLQGKDPFSGEQSLYKSYTSQEELLACTSCNACVEACPVSINPLEIIIEQRRYMALEESSTPSSWNSMFQSLENTGGPWGFPNADRFKWKEKFQNQ